MSKETKDYQFDNEILAAKGLCMALALRLDEGQKSQLALHRLNAESEITMWVLQELKMNHERDRIRASDMKGSFEPCTSTE